MFVLIKLRKRELEKLIFEKDVFENARVNRRRERLDERERFLINEHIQLPCIYYPRLLIEYV